MVQIKFGTDGWRAVIADEYTLENLKRVAEGTGRWLQQRQAKLVVIGYDTRFGGQVFAETTARVLGAMGFRVRLSRTFVSTPMVSLAVVEHKADLGIVITASHNPPEYNGFKLKSKLGGPLIQAEVNEVEALIPEVCSIDTLPTIDMLNAQGLYDSIDMEGAYFEHAEKHFDMEAIRTSGIGVAFDSMYGTAQNIIRRLLPGAQLLHSSFNPSFMGQAPEPIHRNLGSLAAFVAENRGIDCGIATDGDADRIGMYDEDGQFVDSHHILLLLLWYMAEYRKESGKVVITFSVTDRMKRLAEQYGLEIEVTKIGFKYIAEIMAKESVIVGGEESGGLAVKGHIPERDGIWIGLILLEFMAKTGKSLKQLIEVMNGKVGAFAFDRDDLHIEESKKQAVIEACRQNRYTAFGSYTILRSESVDGFKFYLDETGDRWVMIRPSGTEPLLRVYCEAPSEKEVRAILDATQAVLLQ